jgi:KipI family sensor histidine kinase inhibitor
VPPHPSEDALTDAAGLRWRWRAVGPAALRIEVEAPASATLARRLAAVRTRFWARRPPDVHDVVVGAHGLLVEGRRGLAATVVPVLRAILAEEDVGGDPERTVELPVAYGDQADRVELEAALDRRWPEIVAAHAGATYTVAFLGFTPGFPYLHGLPPPLAVPRRPAPHPVPAGAVAIADGRAGVYPTAGPGGWWVLGTTPTRLFDPDRADPAALRPGDAVRFVPMAPEGAAPGAGAPVAGTERGRAAPTPPTRAEATDPALTVLASWPGGATLQGRPRAGVGHLGMAEAGALDPRAHAVAARLAGAPPAAAAIEFLVPQAVLRAERPLTAAWMGGGAAFALDGRDVAAGEPFAWPAGAELRVAPARTPGAMAVLAVGGGLAPAGAAAGHPALRGTSTSTDVRAGVGGLGRALRPHDVLALAGPPGTPDLRWRGRLRLDRPVLLRLHPGPDPDPAALAGLLHARFVVAARDRMGARLDGPRVPIARPDVASGGVPRGAVQVPGDGRPIVLLADRGRTGGYAFVGVVDPADLAALAQARPGAHVLFVSAPGGSAPGRASG